MHREDMNCRDARLLVASYLDGELTEAQAAPLRKHLLACHTCRGSTQSGKHLKRWFVATQPVAVPRDFSARVARLAFAGATQSEDRPVAVPAAAPALVSAAASAVAEKDGRILQFVLRLTVAAAAAALVTSVAIQSLRRPGAAELRADDQRTMTLDQALEKLDELDRAERAARPNERTR
jgi:predicted anti-sigma-YlaC factor YlaD